MRHSHLERRIAITMVLLSLGLAWGACGLGQNAQGEATPRTSGVGLEKLDHYAAAFVVTFTPDDNAAAAWTYSLETVVSGNPPDERQTLTMEGLSAAQDPGDTTLIRVGDTQYMTGEGVGSAGCLIFPAAVDLSESYLMPGDFLPEDALKGLTAAGDAEVAGQSGSRFTFKSDEVDGFTNVEGEIVRAKDGDYLLRYDFSGHTVDTHFSDGAPGTITWRYEITALSPDETFAAPPECEISLPIMPDESGLTRLPGLLTYTTPTSADKVVAYYQQELEADGWLVYNLPATSADTTVLVYARAGELLTVSIKSTAGGTEVQLFLEDRPAQP